MAYSVVVAALVRTDNGRLVHRADCHYILVPRRRDRPTRAVPWQWAEGRRVSEVESALSSVGSRTCRRCYPLVTADIA